MTTEQRSADAAPEFKEWFEHEWAAYPDKDLSINRVMAMTWAVKGWRGADAAPRNEAAVVDEREAFEAWMLSGQLETNPKLERDEYGYYEDFDVQRAWRGWQGRASIAAPTSPATDAAPALHAGGEWKPIETAPKDRMIDLWVSGPGARRIANCRWDVPTSAGAGGLACKPAGGFPKQWVTLSGFGMDPRNGVVTHWMDEPGAPIAADELDVKVSEELHHDTAKLVRRFARALANKLLAAQRKYGYGAAWANEDWQDECRADLMKHISKGDPRDVAAYCAFMWHHGWCTRRTAMPSNHDDLIARLQRMLRTRSDRPQTKWLGDGVNEPVEASELLAALETLQRERDDAVLFADRYQVSAQPRGDGRLQRRVEKDKRA